MTAPVVTAGPTTGTTDATHTTDTVGTADAPMTHRQILEALSGLLLGMFVAMLSATVVTNALPRIIGELGGGQSGYTWVVTSTLLATTASTPIWGKLADLFSRKLLVQLSLAIFVVGSGLAGLAPSVGWLIGARTLQGIGAGGLTALVQVVMAAMIAPRERGRYSGYLGAVFAVATISGPLLGGVIVDTSWLGWRWCFYVGLPFAVAAAVVLQKTLHLPTVRRDDVKVDYLGAGLIVGGVSLLLVWVSLAGHQFAWASTQTALMVAGGLLLLALAVLTEARAAEPVIPLRLFRDRNTSLATAASLFVGITIFGATVFLSQYFQLSRDKSPTVSGLMSLPMVGGLLVSSIVVGRFVSRSGRYKKYVVGGAALILIGALLLSTLDAHTSFWLISTYMLVLGIGLGATMQNLVLAVQNTVAQRDMGSASSTVAFFRSLGGAMGVAVLGALFATHVSDQVAAGLARIGVRPTSGTAGQTLPDLDTLPGPVRSIVENAYGDGIGHTFLLGAPFALLTLLAVIAMREVPLRHTVELAEPGADQTELALAGTRA
jgi:EmrB/QacA subfamily drug resistance transporter